MLQGVVACGKLASGQPESAILDLNSSKPSSGSDNQRKITGRLIALDLGAKRVGVAISDELQITATPLPLIERRSWKDLLRRVSEIIEGYDARALVIGLPLGLDGREGEAAQQARKIAENFRRSLGVPVYLQDERLTTFSARSEMRSEGIRAEEIKSRIDSESAAIILRDFMSEARP